VINPLFLQPVLDGTRLGAGGVVVVVVLPPAKIKYWHAHVLVTNQVIAAAVATGSCSFGKFFLKMSIKSLGKKIFLLSDSSALYISFCPSMQRRNNREVLLPTSNNNMFQSCMTVTAPSSQQA
jgi:hypothetical protein